MSEIAYKYLLDDRKTEIKIKECDVDNEKIFLQEYVSIPMGERKKLVEMKSIPNFRFFLDLDICKDKTPYTLDKVKFFIEDLSKPTLENILTKLYNRKFPTIWTYRVYHHPIKDIPRLGVHAYVPDLIVTIPIAKMIVRTMITFCTEMDNIIDKCVYEPNTGLTYFHSPRINGPYQIWNNNYKENFDFSIRVPSKIITVTPIENKLDPTVSLLLHLFKIT